MLISRAVYFENENVNLDKGAPETVLSQLACLRASIGVTCNKISNENIPLDSIFNGHDSL